MKLVEPYGGAIVTVKEEAAELYLRRGFKPYKATKPNKRKADLLEEAEAEMTNAELAEAVNAAKKSPTKPRRKKA